MAERKFDDPEASERLDAAIGWWVRVDGGDLSPAELAAFRAWLASDPRNEAAFEEACDFWGSWQALPRRAVRDYLSTQPPRRQRKRLWLAGAIATAAISLFFALDEFWIWRQADFRTGVGELRTITLPDGSRAHLNAASALALNYAGDQRRVILMRGEAWFEVEKDPSRPFTVEAAGGAITARGTAFDVAINKTRIEVTATENSVEVTAEGSSVLVSPGRQTAYGPSLPAIPPYEVDSESVTSWRRGKLIFKDKPLGEVVAALSRFHHGLIVVANAEVRDRRVTGVFRSNQPLDAVRAIETYLGIKSIHVSDYLILLHS